MIFVLQVAAGVAYGALLAALVIYGVVRADRRGDFDLPSGLMVALPLFAILGVMFIFND